jgi:hypothetical protein
VPVEVGRAAHCLTGVVDDEVEPVARVEQVLAERLHTGRVPQVEPEDLQSMAPVGEIGLLRIALGGVAREASGDDEVGTGS